MLGGQIFHSHTNLLKVVNIGQHLRNSYTIDRKAFWDSLEGTKTQNRSTSTQKIQDFPGLRKL